MIENLIMFFQNNLFYIVIVLSLLEILSRTIRIKSMRKKGDSELKVKLDKKQILKTLRIFSTVIGISILLLIGLEALYMLIPKFNYFDNIYKLIITITLIIWFSLIIFEIYRTINEIYNISHGNYAIIEDVLIERKFVNRGRGDRKIIRHSFSFEKYLKKYTNVVWVDNPTFYTSIEGDEFYLVFLKNHKNPLVFNKNIYLISDEENNKIISIDELSNYVKKIKVNSQENNMSNETIELTNKALVNSFYGNNEKKKILILIIISALLSCLSIFTRSTESFFLIFIITMVFIIATFICICYTYSIVRSINKNKYNILKDEVISIKNNVKYNNSDKIIELKFKNYNKPIYENENKYPNINIGDEYYLLFLNNQKEPIKIYDTKKYFYNNQ